MSFYFKKWHWARKNFTTLKIAEGTMPHNQREKVQWG